MTIPPPAAPTTVSETPVTRLADIDSYPAQDFSGLAIRLMNVMQQEPIGTSIDAKITLPNGSTFNLRSSGKAYMAVAGLLSAAPSPQSEGWVPVGESKPKPYVRLLLTAIGDGVHAYHGDEGPTVFTGAMDSQGNYAFTAQTAVGWIVTAWKYLDEPMPLPAAPSDGEKRG